MRHRTTVTQQLGKRRTDEVAGVQTDGKPQARCVHLRWQGQPWAADQVQQWKEAWVGRRPETGQHLRQGCVHLGWRGGIRARTEGNGQTGRQQAGAVTCVQTNDSNAPGQMQECRPGWRTGDNGPSGPQPVTHFGPRASSLQMRRSMGSASASASSASTSPVLSMERTNATCCRSSASAARWLWVACGAWRGREGRE